MKVSVEKITGLRLLQRANSFTTGRESKMTLAKAYKHGHSPIRTQLFWVEATDIPLYVASQLVRSHVGVQFFQLSKRPDRGAPDFRFECKEISKSLKDCADIIDAEVIEYIEEERNDFDAEAITEVITDIKLLAEKVEELTERYDRYTPTDIAFIINAEALINMAHKRLCTKASKDTFDFMRSLCVEIQAVDPDLSYHLVPQCIYRGGICTEPKSCNLPKKEYGQKLLEGYVRMLANS